MIMMISLFFILLTISLLIYILNFNISFKKNNIREKIFPLECGFNPMNSFNLPFSIQFYYISILFLIFDIEISLLLPVIQKLYSNMMNSWMISFFIIMLILMIGLILEWMNNLIKWI